MKILIMVEIQMNSVISRDIRLDEANPCSRICPVYGLACDIQYIVVYFRYATYGIYLYAIFSITQVVMLSPIDIIH